MNNINEAIAEVLRLDAEATPGAWYDQSTPEGGYVEVLVDLDEEWAAGLPDEFAPRRWDARPICTLPAREGAMRPGLPHEQRAADAALITCYRTAAPALAREVQRLQAEVQRLQGEVRQAQTGHDCALVAAYESGLRTGLEAMRYRCASRAARDADGACTCGRPICQPDCARVRLLDLSYTIRALEVE